jgi:hypothetical protein
MFRGRVFDPRLFCLKGVSCCASQINKNWQIQAQNSQGDFKAFSPDWFWNAGTNEGRQEPLAPPHFQAHQGIAGRNAARQGPRYSQARPPTGAEPEINLRELSYPFFYLQPPGVRNWLQGISLSTDARWFAGDITNDSCKRWSSGTPSS